MDDKRLYYIDFLKFLGLTGIILVHADPPFWAVWLRSFDVPIMVFLSAYLAARSFKKYSEKGKTADYIIDRVKRLVIPTWVFLSLYFILDLIFGNLYDVGFYLRSYGMTLYGIAYVWVILIYLYSAVLTPVFDRFKPTILVFLALLIIYSLYEIGIYYDLNRNPFVNNTVFYIIPFGIVAYMGYHYAGFDTKTRILIFVSFLTVFVVGVIMYARNEGRIVNVSTASFPPRIYYLSYGLSVTTGLMLLCRKKELKLFKNPLIVFISKHSMWIYLWHILTVRIAEFLNLPDSWLLRFVFIYVFAVLITFCVDLFFKKIDKDNKIAFSKYLR